MKPPKLNHATQATKRWAVAAVCLSAASLAAWAQTTTPTRAAPNVAATASQGKVIVSGTVPDEATRAAILGKVREVYGADRVVDQLGIGNLVAPPNWAQQVQKIVTPDLRRISQGELKINGNQIDLLGTVANEATRQELPSAMSTALANNTYRIRNGLRVGEPAQKTLDDALANRIVEFEPGNAALTPAGQQVLDSLIPVLQQFQGRRFQVTGHTDADGSRQRNIALSAERAQAVKAYLVQRGIAAATLSTQGAGPDKPLASNATPEGRARNRRIEFRVLA